MIASKPAGPASANTSGKASGQCSGSRSTMPSGRPACMVLPAHARRSAELLSTVLATLIDNARNAASQTPAVQLRGFQPGGGDRVCHNGKGPGEFAASDKQPSLVLDVADRHDRGGGDPPAQVGGPLQPWTANRR